MPQRSRHITELLQFFTKPLLLGGVQFESSLWQMIYLLIFPWLLALIIRWSLKKLGLYLVGISQIEQEKQNKIKHNLIFILNILFLLSLILIVANFFGGQILKWSRLFLSFLREPFFSSGKTKISIMTLFSAVPIFYFASFMGKKTQKMAESSFLKRLKIDEAARFSIGSLSRYGVMIIISLFGLSIIGLDLSALGVILGVLGIGLGFGLQSIVSNFFAGLIIISTRPIKEGDRVKVNNCDGIVHRIKMISTDIKTFENENIIIPNSFFVDNPVHNYSYSDKRVVIVNTVQVSYDANLKQVETLLLGINRENPYRLEGSANVFRCLSFDDSGISVALRTLVKDVSQKAAAHSWTNMQIWTVFKEEGIEIPYPQLDVKMKP